MNRPLLAGGGEACRHVEKAFYACLADHGMEALLRRGVLLAFSGGQDSMLLLALMAAYTKGQGIPLAAVHVHHGIRGTGADRDAAFCQKTAEEWGIPFFFRRVDVPAYEQADGRGGGQEAAARALRYAALTDVMQQAPTYGCCVTAHHATDNLETVLLNMLRGSGAKGLCGIPPVRGCFLRPLLYVPRRDVAAAVAELSLPFVIDETNESDRYDRNYIRAHLLPCLAHLRPDPEAAVTRLCTNLREEIEPLDRAAEEFYAQHETDRHLPRAALLAQPRAVAFRVLTRLFAACGAVVRPERIHLSSLLSILSSQTSVGQCPMPGGFVAVFDQNSVTFCAAADGFSAPYDIPLQMGENVLGESGGSLWLFPQRNVEFEVVFANVYNLFIQAKLDSVTIEMLRARTRQEGDAYRYGGMTRRVRRLMAGKHLSPAMRAAWPIVCDEAGILWVPGFGVREGRPSKQAGLYAYYTYGKRDGGPRAGYPIIQPATGQGKADI